MENKEYFIVNSDGDVILDFTVSEDVLEQIKENILDVSEE